MRVQLWRIFWNSNGTKTPDMAASVHLRSFLFGTSSYLKTDLCSPKSHFISTVNQSHLKRPLLSVSNRRACCLKLRDSTRHLAIPVPIAHVFYPKFRIDTRRLTAPGQLSQHRKSRVLDHPPHNHQPILSTHPTTNVPARNLPQLPPAALEPVLGGACCRAAGATLPGQEDQKSPTIEMLHL